MQSQRTIIEGSLHELSKIILKCILSLCLCFSPFSWALLSLPLHTVTCLLAPSLSLNLALLPLLPSFHQEHLPSVIYISFLCFFTNYSLNLTICLGNQPCHHFQLPTPSASCPPPLQDSLCPRPHAISLFFFFFLPDADTQLTILEDASESMIISSSGPSALPPCLLFW